MAIWAIKVTEKMTQTSLMASMPAVLVAPARPFPHDARPVLQPLWGCNPRKVEGGRGQDRAGGGVTDGGHSRTPARNAAPGRAEGKAEGREERI